MSSARPGPSWSVAGEDGIIETTAGEGLYVSPSTQSPTWRVEAQHVVSYEVRVCAGLLDPSDPTLATAGGTEPQETGRRLIVVDARVHDLHGAGIQDYFTTRGVTCRLCVVDAHERAKTMDSVCRIASAMDGFGVSRRREPVIAVGGGVLTDLVGLAASLYRRSTPYVRVPTTLIGMVDAGIGAKTGVNFRDHKNRLGSYHPAAVTLIDPSFLTTLSPRHLRNGLAEVLKLALMRDPALFDLLAAHGPRLVSERMQRAGSADGGAAAAEVMRRSIDGMLRELQPNLWEHRLQRVVDYGHSFSPKIEMRALPDLLHGEAVAVDMAFSIALANARGLLSAADTARVLDVLAELGLPTWHPVCTPELLSEALADTVAHRDGQQLLPLTDGIGAARFVNDVTVSELADALATLTPNVLAGAGGRRG